MPPASYAIACPEKGGGGGNLFPQQVITKTFNLILILKLFYLEFFISCPPPPPPRPYSYVCIYIYIYITLFVMGGGG